MVGTLSIQGDLVVLSELAVKIEEWFPGMAATDVRPDSSGGWTIDSMTTLLERLHPWQLLLVSFVALAGGRRSDPEVREKFAIGGSGLRGQTGAISKHIEAMKTAGAVPGDANYVLKVDRTAHVPVFVTPKALVPLVQAALAQPTIEKALVEARKTQRLDERE
jgi:hypothetical protein